LLLTQFFSDVPDFQTCDNPFEGSRRIKTEHIQDHARSKTHFSEAFLQGFLKSAGDLWIRNSQAIQKLETYRKQQENKTGRNNWINPMTHNL